MEDVYGELDNYDTLVDVGQLKEENAKLHDCIKDLNKTIERLTEENETLSVNYKNLETNYSTLLMTARAEIERKTKMIATLNTEKDQLIFRHLGNKNILPRNQFRKVVGKPAYEQKNSEPPKNNKRKIDDMKNVENKVPRLESATHVTDHSIQESRTVIENKTPNPSELPVKECPKEMPQCVKPGESNMKTRCIKARGPLHRQVSRTISRADSPMFSSDDEVSETNHNISDHSKKPKITEVHPETSPSREIERSDLQINKKHEINRRTRDFQKYERPVSTEPRGQEVILEAPYDRKEDLRSRLLKTSERGHIAERKHPQESDESHRKITYPNIRRNRSPSPNQRYGKPKRDYRYGRPRSRNEKQIMERYRQFWSPDLEDEDIVTKAPIKDLKEHRRNRPSSRDRELRSRVPERDHWEIDRKNRTKSRDRRRLVSPPYRKEHRPRSTDRRRNEYDLGHKRTHSYESRYHENLDRRPKISEGEYECKDADKPTITGEKHIRKEDYQIHGVYRDTSSEGKDKNKTLGQVKYNNEHGNDEKLASQANENQEIIKENSTCSEKVIKDCQKGEEIRNCQSPDEGQNVEVAPPVVNIKTSGNEELTIKDDPRLYNIKYFTDSDIERNKNISPELAKSYQFKIRNRRDIDLKMCSFNDTKKISKSLTANSDLVNEIYMEVDTEGSNDSVESGEILEPDDLYNIAFENKKTDIEKEIAQPKVPHTIKVSTDISSGHNVTKPKIDDSTEHMHSENENNVSQTTSKLLSYKIPKKLNRIESVESPPASKPYHYSLKVIKMSNNNHSEPNMTMVKTNTPDEFIANIRNCNDTLSESRNRSPTPVPENAFDEANIGWKSPQHEVDESLTRDLRRRLKRIQCNTENKHFEKEKQVQINIEEPLTENAEQPKDLEVIDEYSSKVSSNENDSRNRDKSKENNSKHDSSNKIKTPENSKKSENSNSVENTRNKSSRLSVTPAPCENFVEDKITTTPKSSRKAKPGSEYTKKTDEPQTLRDAGTKLKKEEIIIPKADHETQRKCDDFNLCKNKQPKQSNNNESSLTKRSKKETMIVLFGENSLIMPEDLDEAFKESVPLLQKECVEIPDIREFGDIELKKQTEIIFNSDKSESASKNFTEKLHSKSNKRSSKSKDNKMKEDNVSKKVEEDTPKEKNKTSLSLKKSRKSTEDKAQTRDSKKTLSKFKGDHENKQTVPHDNNEKGKQEETKLVITKPNSHQVENAIKVAQSIVLINESNPQIKKYIQTINPTSIDMPSIADVGEKFNANLKRTDDKPGNIAQTLLEMHNQIVKNDKEAKLTPHHTSSNYIPFNTNFVTSTPNPKASTEINPQKDLFVQSPIKQVETFEQIKTNNVPEEFQLSNKEIIEPPQSNNTQTNPPPLKIFVRRRRVVVKK